MGNLIQFYNRYTQTVEDELIYGEPFLKFLYGSRLGKLTLNKLVRRKLFSEIYGRLMRYPSSRRKIKPFVERYHLAPETFEKKLDQFTSFDDFFARKLKSKARPIAVAHDAIVFPADGRHLLLQNTQHLPSYFIKGQKFNLKKLLQNDALVQQFQGGPVVISRLAPVDYHRFHFPYDAAIQKIYKVNGDYYSVNPIAIRKRIGIFFENKRIVSVLHTEDLGPVLMVAVGATCVGSIVQTAEVGRRYFKGEEMGYFHFGGSTVLTIFQKDRVTFAEDLCRNAENGIETFAFMGDHMGVKV